MDDEFPKTLNAAVDTAGKVHGSLTHLEELFVSLKSHLGELVTHLKSANAAVKAGPVPEVVVSEPEPEPIEARQETVIIDPNDPEK